MSPRLAATIERVRQLYLRDVWRTTTTCAPVLANTLRLVERIRELEASLTRETETIARLHETITGVTDVHARDMRTIATALGLSVGESWDIDEITKRATEEHTARKSYEEGITWETTCLGCASWVSRCYAETMRAETAEAERDAAMAARERDARHLREWIEAHAPKETAT